MKTASDALAAEVLCYEVIYRVEVPAEEEELPAAVSAAAVAVHVLIGAVGYCLLQAPGTLPCAGPAAETAAAGCPA